MSEVRKIVRNDEKKIQNTRFVVQSIFLVLCLWIGVEFYLFVKSIDAGISIDGFERPPGVEGFLPISALMSLRYLFISGEVHSVHPAGLIIFAAIVMVSFLVGKSFCSWFCPIGFISELIGDFGDKIYKKIFNRKLLLPKFLDYPLRSLKYILLAFFLFAVFFLMNTNSLKMFLDSDYNLVSEVKMYYFFAELSITSVYVISFLVIASIFVKNFWCRYLCPYGALLGIISFLSPLKIKRDSSKCIDCSLCAKACPSRIKVDKVKTVISDECSSCLSCIDACPVKDTLFVSPRFKTYNLNKKYVAIAIVATYTIICLIGYFTGNWQNNIPKSTYIGLHPRINSIGHPTGKTEIDKMNQMSEERENQKIHGPK